MAVRYKAAMRLEVRLTKAAYVRLAVNHGENCGASQQAKATQAEETYDRVMWLCWRYDHRRITRNENHEYELTFYIQM